MMAEDLTCAECHDDQVETKNSSFHRTVSCETCHGAAAEHAREEAEDDPPLPTGRELCRSCHRYLVSRPPGFPQAPQERHDPATPSPSVPIARPGAARRPRPSRA